MLRQAAVLFSGFVFNLVKDFKILNDLKANGSLPKQAQDGANAPL